MHTDKKTTVLQSRYSGYRHKELLEWILVTPLLILSILITS